MELKLKVKEEYAKGLSANKVAEKLGISMWRVYKILEYLDVPRRSSAVSNKINFLTKPKSYTFRKNLTNEQKKLWHSGLMLYLGEGSKRSSWTVDLANCDREIILIFLKMLREIYGVSESRLRVLIYSHSNKNPDDLIDYWSKLTSIPKNQFTKPYVRTSFQGEQSDKMKYGLVHIRYSDKRLWQAIMDDVHKLIKNLLG